MTRVLAAVLLLITMAVVLAIITAIPVMLIWNNLVVDKFHLPGLTLWEAWQLTFLCGMLFKGTSTTSTKD